MFAGLLNSLASKSLARSATGKHLREMEPAPVTETPQIPSTVLACPLMSINSRPSDIERITAQIQLTTELIKISDFEVGPQSNHALRGLKIS